MKNQYTEAMSLRTDEKLIKMITVDRSNYAPEAVIAAEKEAKKRNIETIKGNGNIETVKDSGSQMHDIELDRQYYVKQMSELTNKDLVEIATTKRESFNPAAVDAAEQIIEERKISKSKLVELESNSIISNQQKVEINKISADKGLRFVNFAIDYVVCTLLSVIVYFAYVYLYQPQDFESSRKYGTILFLGVVICYYFIMEIFSQKTIGKIVTETKVVSLNGDKPGNLNILTRTLCRIIPLEPITFLFSRMGLHDYVSGTIVIKEATIKKY